MSKQPVTELYEAALQLWPRVAVTSSQEAERLRSVAERLDGPAIAVLDLVATLPPGRLGLVRWVAGLGEEEQALLGQALANQQELVDEWAPEEAEDARRFVAMREGFVAAVSGGEGGAKCPECHGAGKVKRLEGGGSIRVVKYDPCPKCAAGAAQAMEEAAKDEDTKPREPGCQCHIEEGDLPCRVHGEDEDSTKPTILRAGKPPPFLRVGMVLTDPRNQRRRHLWGRDRSTTRWRFWMAEEDRYEWEDEAVLLTWPLAEPFTVEGETAPAERRKPCTCNSSPSPRRCDGQARLGGGWYCVEGKP